MKKIEFERLIDFRDTADSASHELKDLLLLNRIHNLGMSEEEVNKLRIAVGYLYRIWNRTERKIQKEFESRGWN